MRGEYTPRYRKFNHNKLIVNKNFTQENRKLKSIISEFSQKKGYFVQIDIKPEKNPFYNFKSGKMYQHRIEVFIIDKIIFLKFENQLN